MSTDDETAADEEDQFEKQARRIMARGEQYAIGYLAAMLEHQHVLIQSLNERASPESTP